jgi:hypothetical protein
MSSPVENVSFKRLHVLKFSIIICSSRSPSPQDVCFLPPYSLLLIWHMIIAWADCDLTADLSRTTFAAGWPSEQGNKQVKITRVGKQDVWFSYEEWCYPPVVWSCGSSISLVVMPYIAPPKCQLCSAGLNQYILEIEMQDVQFSNSLAFLLKRSHNPFLKSRKI